VESLSIGVKPVLEAGIICQISSRDGKGKISCGCRKEKEEKGRGGNIRVKWRFETHEPGTLRLSLWFAILRCFGFF
jgi:hypothetical protein